MRDSKRGNSSAPRHGSLRWARTPIWLARMAPDTSASGGRRLASWRLESESDRVSTAGPRQDADPAPEIPAGAGMSGKIYPARFAISIAATTAVISTVAAQPKIISKHGAANAPMILRLPTISIIAAISGTATTPLTTALQNNIRIGLNGLKAAIRPASVAAPRIR